MSIFPENASNTFKLYIINSIIGTVLYVLVNILFIDTPISWEFIIGMWVVGFFLVCIIELYDLSHIAEAKEKELSERVEELKVRIVELEAKSEGYNPDLE
jgi:hypothetical protein